jgi:hypothetical protein
MFNFIFSIGNDAGFGTVDATAQGGGAYLATSGIVTVTASTSSQDLGTYLLASASGDSLFDWDNIFSPTGTPTLDTTGYSGFVFIGISTLGNPLEINIWADPNYATNDSYGFWSSTGSGYNVSDGGPSYSGYSGVYQPISSGSNVTFTAAATPEPSGILLLATMLLGVGITCRRSFGRG